MLRKMKSFIQFSHFLQVKSQKRATQSQKAMIGEEEKRKQQNKLKVILIMSNN